jgi:hypothetical protein
MRLHFVIGSVYAISAKERLKQRSGVPRLADSALTCRIANCDLQPMQHSSKSRGSEDICVAFTLTAQSFSSTRLESEVPTRVATPYGFVRDS